MAKKKKNTVLSTVITIIVIAAVIWMKVKETRGTTASEASRPDKELARPGDASPMEGGARSRDGDGAMLDVLTPARASSNKFTTIDGCRMVDHRNNDGDSFHVNVPGRGDMELRLYYADTPESRLHQYNGKRIGQQAASFGINQSQTIQVGADAKYFVKDLFKGKSFTISTQWEDVYEGPRKYSFIIVNWRGKNVYLHELLIAHGLARIHTQPMVLPDNTSVTRQKKQLRKLESYAKSKKYGAWGIAK